MELLGTSLDDKYKIESGRIFLNGIQALVRLPLMQHARDKAAGLNTGGFISGYRGSPLGGFDLELWRTQRLLTEANIRFQPGVNEDLAATSIWGTQQVNLYPGATVDGVFGIWYGKGPGVDRSADALKHANLAGTSPTGGVLALAGDDHTAQSSSAAHQSEQVLIAAMIPVLNPANLDDYLEFGLYGFALSRYSGCWVGFKSVSQLVESSASIEVDATRPRLVVPKDFVAPAGGLGIRWPDWPVDQEKRLHGPKMQAVSAFTRANPLDRIVMDSPQPRFGVFATGKAYTDLRQALFDLGIDEHVAAKLGIRLYKIGLTWPLERSAALHAADGLQEVLVVEEKRAVIEDQLRSILYHVDASRRPRIVGKCDESGKPLLPSEGELNPAMIAGVLLDRLSAISTDVEGPKRRFAQLQTSLNRPGITPSKTVRVPFFCSGCPHNSSTKLPEGSRASAGIGCHGMVTWMPYRNTEMITHMGGEGMLWVGQASFTTEPHIFQNLGDGTYTHSGLLAVRAASASGVNITYKILYNDAVAMTGGQPTEGHMSVPQMTFELAAEGARKIVVVTEDRNKYPPGASFAPGVDIRHRDDLDAVQRELREIKGLTVLVYDQTCAAEKRRRRKRGSFPDPQKRVFINDAVCEGCGDCSEQSHCISVMPLETEFGRKRQIDQTSCNKDFSCLKGFCPSFVTINGGGLKKSFAAIEDARLEGLPTPQIAPLDTPYSILVVGIGGTGVITVGAILSMAAHLEGKGCSGLDATGLAQKNGGVLSHVRIAAHPNELHSPAIPAGGASLLLACDMVFAAAPTPLSKINPGLTHAVVNTYVAPTASFVADGDFNFEAASLRKLLSDAIGTGGIDFIDGTGLATRLLGDTVTANMLMLGYAIQKGWIPLSLAAIERAVELNGVAVAENKRAIDWGRLVAHDPATFSTADKSEATEIKAAQTLGELVERRARFLTEYQDAPYAARYRDFVSRVELAEKSKAKSGDTLARAVAEGLFKLMAYKDEYEVARLYAHPDFAAKLKSQFQGDFKLGFNLAPPLLASIDKTTGLPKKMTFGPWMFGAFKMLARLKGLRNTPFDIFSYTEERKVERKLIAEYQRTIEDILESLTPANRAMAVTIAALPQKMRGFGHVKMRNIVQAREELASLMTRFRNPSTMSEAAE